MLLQLGRVKAVQILDEFDQNDVLLLILGVAELGIFLLEILLQRVDLNKSGQG